MTPLIFIGDPDASVSKRFGAQAIAGIFASALNRPLQSRGQGRGLRKKWSFAALTDLSGEHLSSRTISRNEGGIGLARIGKQTGHQHPCHGDSPTQASRKDNVDYTYKPIAMEPAGLHPERSEAWDEEWIRRGFTACGKQTAL
ncbi:MAG: hypothetical protein ACRESZ_14775 [Methylococcales bacterium]